MKNCAITFLVLMVSATGYSQLYPVRGTATLTAPYSLYMADYASPVSQAMAVNLFLADENELNYQVKLRVTIQGAGITLRLKENVQVNPILLNGNIPVRLSGPDLEPYFNPQHYDFFGLTYSNFIAGGGKLPEGIYEFCFQVFDYYRDVPVSARFCASAWLLLNDPPFLNQPFNQSKVVVQNPQTIRFQWTPMHRNSPNSAFDTDYTLYIKEYTLDDVNIDPYELMGSPVRTIFTTTTEQTSFVYDIDEPALTPGKRYAFAVQAKDRSGRDMFKNQGLSEVYVFTYGDMLDPVEGIEGKALSHHEASFHWSSKPSQSRYSFRYREAGSEEWKEKDLLMNELKVSDLDANTSYDYQVRAWYGIAEGPWSETMTIKTLIGNPVSDFACGATPAQWNLGNTALLPALAVGDTIRASDFIVVLTNVTGGEGVFSGEGMIEVPFLNQHLKSEYSDPKVKLLVAFENINVNTDKRMIVGEMKVKSGGVQVTSDYYARTISDAVMKVDIVLADLETIASELEQIEETVREFLGDEEVQIDESEFANFTPLELVEEAKRMVEEAEQAIKNKDVKGVEKLKKGLALLKKALKLLDEFKNTGEYATHLLAALLEIVQENASLYAEKAESLINLFTGYTDQSLPVGESASSIDRVEKIGETFSMEVTPSQITPEDKAALDKQKAVQDAIDFVMLNRYIFLMVKYYTAHDNYSRFLEEFLHEIDSIYPEYKEVLKTSKSEADVRAFLKKELSEILEAHVQQAIGEPTE